MSKNNSVQTSLYESGGDKQLKVFLLSIIDQYGKIREDRLRYVLFFGETVQIEKTSGETIGSEFYYFNNGFKSDEFETLINTELAVEHQITVTKESIVPYKNPIIFLEKDTTDTLRYDTDCEMSELGKLAAEATKHKSLADLKFWYEHSELATRHEENEVLTRKMMRWYSDAVRDNKIIPEWSTLI